MRPRLGTTASVGILVLWIVFPFPGVACRSIEPTERIAIDLGGGQAALLAIYVEERPDADPGMSLAGSASMSEPAALRCSAVASFPLSAFPTSRLAARPAEIARSMQDIMKKLGVDACEVSTFYENDTSEEIAEHELCLTETFAFGERKHWSISSESFCWEPAGFEIVSADESL